MLTLTGRPVDLGRSPCLRGSKTPSRDRTPSYPQPSTRSGCPGCNTRRPPRNSSVLCLGEAELRHLVRVQHVMVRLLGKHGPAVKFMAGGKFLPGGLYLPDGKLLPAVMCHPRPTVCHAEFYHVSWGQLCCGVLVPSFPSGGSNVSWSRARVSGMEARTPFHTPDST